MYCWGTSRFGSATGSNMDFFTQVLPTPLQTSIAFKHIAPGIGNNLLNGICGLATDDTAYCWGSNSSGQIGSTVQLPNTCTFSTSAPPFGCTGVPTAVMTSERFSTLVVGSEQNCGLTISHQILCWGRNNFGQVGDGTTTNRSTPTQVLGNLRVP